VSKSPTTAGPLTSKSKTMTPTVTLQPSLQWWKQTVYMNATTHINSSILPCDTNYPVVSTLVKAIDKGYLKEFASLTSCHVCQHIKINNEAEKGHMGQSQQGKHSTKASSPAGNLPPFPPDCKLIDTMAPLPQEPFNTRTHIIFMTIIEITGILFSNQLG
jgi:hypothetical protein